MKKILLCGIALTASLLTGCIKVDESKDRSDESWTRHCTGTFTKLTMIKGHEYLLTRNYDRGISTIHAASCPCRYKNLIESEVFEN